MLCRLIALPAVLGVLLFSAAGANAQMNNRPFEFGGVVGGNTGITGSSGMSAAGRQAILEQELTGRTPDNLRIGPDGGLLTIEQGPGRTAIATDSSGAVIPQFRGSFNTGRTDFAVLSLFSPSRRGVGSTLLPQPRTGLALSGWISMVGERPVLAGNLSATGAAIDEWTSQVFGS